MSLWWIVYKVISLLNISFFWSYSHSLSIFSGWSLRLLSVTPSPDGLKKDIQTSLSLFSISVLLKALTRFVRPDRRPSLKDRKHFLSLSCNILLKSPQAVRRMFEIPQTPSSSGVFIKKKKVCKKFQKRKKKKKVCQNCSIGWVLMSYSEYVCMCKRSPWCLFKDVICFPLVVEVCFVFLELETYPVSVSSRKEWPEGKTTGGEDSKLEKESVWVQRQSAKIRQQHSYCDGTEIY